MKIQIKEFAKLTGVSVRTLHYYDEIGLLVPSMVDEQTGYRFYDERSLERMQEILFYRELDFPLKTILQILSSPSYDKQKALSAQKRLLILKKERLERLIRALEETERGETEMSMKVFDNTEFEETRQKYADEVKERWGGTSAYREYGAKTAGYSKDNWDEIQREAENIFRRFAQCVSEGNSPSDEPAQKLVRAWQEHITKNHYTCTKEILSGLGQMYVADERFKQNLDRYGEGTAEFMALAIREYCVR